MTWLIFLASSLAVFRLTRLITDDKVTDWLRAFVVRQVPRKAKRKAKQGITCPFCVSFYYSAIFSVSLWMAGFYGWEWILFWQPAIWGAANIFNEVFTYLATYSEG
jgi:hypothetical protein